MTQFRQSTGTFGAHRLGNTTCVTGIEDGVQSQSRGLVAEREWLLFEGSVAGWRGQLQ